MQSLNNFMLMAYIKTQGAFAAIGYGGLTDGVDKANQARINKLTAVFDSVLGIFITIMLGSMTAIGAVYGFKYASAKKADKAKEAKQQIIRLFVGMLIAIVITIGGAIGLDMVKKYMTNK